VRQAQSLAARAPESLLACYMNAALPAADAAAAEGNDDSPIERVFAAARDGDRETQYMIILGGLFAAGQDMLVLVIPVRVIAFEPSSLGVTE
jgi:hypothetical protein